MMESGLMTYQAVSSLASHDWLTKTRMRGEASALVAIVFLQQ